MADASYATAQLMSGVTRLSKVIISVLCVGFVACSVLPGLRQFLALVPGK